MTAKNSKIFIFGLDRAGKTAFINTIKERQTKPDTTPTLSLRIDTFMLKEVKVQIWDAPGQKPFRKFWGQGIDKNKLLVSIIDCSDLERIQEAKNELMKVLNNPATLNTPLMICFHKMDLDVSKGNLPQIRSVLEISKIRGRKVLSYETSIYTMKSMIQLIPIIENILLDIMW